MTARGPAAEWLNERIGRVPADVRGRLVPVFRGLVPAAVAGATESATEGAMAGATTGATAGASEGSIEALVPALCDAADRALDAAGHGAGEHRGAFQLLRADALVTLACEAALSADEPDRVLVQIVSRVAS